MNGYRNWKLCSWNGSNLYIHSFAWIASASVWMAETNVRHFAGNILNRFSCLKYFAFWFVFSNISSQVSNQPYPSFGVNNKHRSPMESPTNDVQWGALVFSFVASPNIQLNIQSIYQLFKHNGAHVTSL